MMEPTDSDLGYRLDFWCLYFSRFILEFNNIIVSIVDDVSISSKTFVVTSFKELKIKIYRLSLSLLKVCCKVCILKMSVYVSTLIQRIKKIIALTGKSYPPWSTLTIPLYIYIMDPTKNCFEDKREPKVLAIA
jgi:hypothetical protein